MLDGVRSGPTWRKCTPCDVAWESEETDCWICGTKVAARYDARPAITSQVSPVSAMRDSQCRTLNLPL